MSIREYNFNDELTAETAIGCVIGEREHYWMDGMLEIFALYYNAETDSIESKQTAYIGADGRNLMCCGHDIDLTVKNARRAMRCLKRSALHDYGLHLRELQRTFAKGNKVWISAEYCEHIQRKTESAKQRKAWIKHKTWWYTQGYPYYREIDRKLQELKA